jgi:glutamate 5-kinase
VVVPVVHLLLHLRLDEAAFFFHHDDVFQAAGEFADAVRFQRPGHADLVHADADVLGRLVVDAEVFERLFDLLPGVVSYEGVFKNGDVVVVEDMQGAELGRGITNYAVSDLAKIADKKAKREFIDKNYAGVLIVWDRLFGTFEPERARV